MKKSLHNFKIFFLSFYFVLIPFIISSCGKDSSCLSGDNFSGKNTYFDSNFPANSPGYYDDAGAFDSKFGLVRWQDTGYETDGSDIVVQIRGRWSPWGYGPMSVENISCGSSGNVIITQNEIEKECKNFISQDLASLSGEIFNGKFIGLSKPSNEYPCWLSNGMGLYLLIIDEKINPNETLNKMKYPDNGATIHFGSLGADGFGRIKISASDGMYDLSGYKVPIKPKQKIYMKIIDSFYVDNFGYYDVDFLKGVSKGSISNIFNSTYNWVTKDFFENIKNIFNDIISQDAYKNSILALLILYISITSLAFLMGFIKAQLGELVLRLLKVGLVLIMLTPWAWTFFNDHLFKIYFYGVNEIISVVAGNESNFDKDKPFIFIDDIINKFFSDDFWKKRMASILYANFLLGLLWTLFIAFVLFFMFIMFLYCFCIYILGIFVLGFLTLMLPVFIIFILFNFTKNFFNDWVNLVISNSFKILMTFITLIFFANIIELEIQKTVGYKICPANVINFNPFSSDSDPYKHSPLALSGYVPGETAKFKTINPFLFIYGMVTMQKRYDFDPIVVNMLVPPFYDYSDYRYQSLPFLNPNTKKRPDISAINLCFMEKTLDACHPDLLFPEDIGLQEHTQIKDMMFASSSVEFIYFWRLFAMLILVVVLWVIGIHFIESIAEYIAMGGEGIVMPSSDLGSGIKSLHRRYEMFVQQLAGSNNKIKKYLGMGLMLSTTTEGFILRSKSPLRKYASKAYQNFPNLTEDISEKLNISGKLRGVTGGVIGGDHWASRMASDMFGSLVDNVRYFDSSADDSSTRSFKSLSRKKKENEINMSGLNEMRDRLGLFIEGTGKTLDNIQYASLVNSMNPLEHSINSLKLGASVAKWAINGASQLYSNQKVFEDFSSSDLKKDFYRSIFDAKFLGVDVSKEVGIDEKFRFDSHLHSMDDYYKNLQRQDDAERREFASLSGEEGAENVGASVGRMNSDDLNNQGGSVRGGDYDDDNNYPGGPGFGGDSDYRGGEDFMASKNIIREVDYINSEEKIEDLTLLKRANNQEGILGEQLQNFNLNDKYEANFNFEEDIVSKNEEYNIPNSTNSDISKNENKEEDKLGYTTVAGESGGAYSDTGGSYEPSKDMSKESDYFISGDKIETSIPFAGTNDSEEQLQNFNLNEKYEANFNFEQGFVPQNIELSPENQNEEDNTANSINSDMFKNGTQEDSLKSYEEYNIQQEELSEKFSQLNQLEESYNKKEEDDEINTKSSFNLENTDSSQNIQNIELSPGHQNEEDNTVNSINSDMPKNETQEDSLKSYEEYNIQQEELSKKFSQLEQLDELYNKKDENEKDEIDNNSSFNIQNTESSQNIQNIEFSPPGNHDIESKISDSEMELRLKALKDGGNSNKKTPDDFSLEERLSMLTREDSEKPLFKLNNSNKMDKDKDDLEEKFEKYRAEIKKLTNELNDNPFLTNEERAKIIKKIKRYNSLLP